MFDRLLIPQVLSIVCNGAVTAGGKWSVIFSTEGLLLRHTGDGRPTVASDFAVPVDLGVAEKKVEGLSIW